MRGGGVYIYIELTRETRRHERRRGIYLHVYVHIERDDAVGSEARQLTKTH